ncbi:MULTISPECIES: molybdopterin converting factor subunit 1 [unclassified Lysinibacillus]|uniref:molybdopterin converting factor subunit 1 n=1 Tax=unclassified Lysinibacillus TaxID=2636778 RepID=UPI001052790E|nr:MULTISPECIES: molybdopterin converting factor subunit 1 [unclassified Lysinibacillus]MDD1502144.1 molybdopterin converting factor subunit 1 [Lysinibacillus sp. CNPSo 3705]UPW82219.1 molybdopterin converting factor subunit 1 [Lysinibacillus sp. Ag94]
MINILLFAHLQEMIGESKLCIDLADHTVGQIKEWMETQYSQVNLQHVMTAVNEEFATDATVVKKGDTIAFIPPISGG